MMMVDMEVDQVVDEVTAMLKIVSEVKRSDGFVRVRTQ